MTAVLTPNAKQQFFDNNGRPLVGGKLFSYDAGTTTKRATYVNAAGITTNSNPIVLDYRAECNLWIPPNIGYKFVLAPANDTDPPTHAIWTVDNVKSSQLITLYGGVDTGVADAYVINFTASFDAYADGIVIYWIPSHTNNGASTINVNGLGPVAIVNAAGTPLVAGQIVQNQPSTIIFQSGSFLLIPSGQLGDGTLGPVLSGSWVPTWFGFSSAPTGTINWVRIGRLITLSFGANCTGTSNANELEITNVPNAVFPLSTGNPIVPFFCAIDGGAPTVATLLKTASSTFVFFRGTAPPDDAGWTNSGSKGFEPGTSIVYSV